jgi:hypothetical protein
MAMIVYINQQEIVIFAGARIQDAILAYSRDELDRVIKGDVLIFDRFGNLTDPDGAMIEGQHFTLKSNDKL